MSQNPAIPSPTKNNSLPAYFQQGEHKETKAQKGRDAMKIAEAGKESHAGADLSMRVDLQQLAGKLDNMKTGLLSKL